MTALKTPRTKLLIALALLGALLATSSSQGFEASTVARIVLAFAGLGGLTWWLHRKHGSTVDRSERRRMQVVDRTGLSARCGLALVAIDGREFLVAFGDGFAEIAPAAVAARSTQGRRPMPRSRRSAARGAR